MIALKRSPLDRVVFVVALTALALILSLLMRPVLQPDFFPLFLVTVLLSAWYHGRQAGLLATALSAVAVFSFFLLPDRGSATSAASFVRLGFFMIFALLITWLTSAWRASHGLLAATLSSIGEAVLATDGQGRITFLNPVAEALTGWKQPDVQGRPVTEVMKLLLEEGREPAEDPVGKALSEGTTSARSEGILLLSHDGTEIPIAHTVSPIRDRGGELRGAILVFRDVTARRQMEQQLRDSQKLDAVGRLAGEVAGDFNNVLTVITGYSELLRADLPAGLQRRFAEEILYSAERAAGLTRQLLAFSRGPAAQPRLLDLNSLLATMEPMLARMLGESIELIVLSGPALGRVHADPNQIEQVVINLATNARDAMPEGGKLVVETANVDLEDPAGAAKVGVKPGSYVMVAVSDTGMGMDAGTRSHLFEPFFTTKQAKGSGLGLSTVYGIVRQSEGQITVYSQPGCGTIFEIYLPRTIEPAGAVTVAKSATSNGSETILLVDDEEGVRKLVFAILKSHGYEVIEAANGSSALAAYEKNAHKIDLVLTDIVMPQMNGFELGQRLTDRKPELRILYMSGYRDNPIGAQQGGRNGSFLHKPFTPDVLLSKVREVLDHQ